MQENPSSIRLLWHVSLMNCRAKILVDLADIFFMEIELSILPWDSLHMISFWEVEKERQNWFFSLTVMLINTPTDRIDFLSHANLHRIWCIHQLDKQRIMGIDLYFNNLFLVFVRVSLSGNKSFSLNMVLMSRDWQQVTEDMKENL